MGGPVSVPISHCEACAYRSCPLLLPLPRSVPPPPSNPPPRTVPLCRPHAPPPSPTCSVALPDLRCRLGAVLGRHSTGLAFRDRPKTQREACPTPVVRIHPHCTPFPPSPRARPAPFGHIAGAMPVPHPKSVPAKTAAFCASRRARAWPKSLPGTPSAPSARAIMRRASQTVSHSCAFRCADDVRSHGGVCGAGGGPSRVLPLRQCHAPWHWSGRGGRVCEPMPRSESALLPPQSHADLDICGL